MNRVEILIGLPGAGKDTVARQAVEIARTLGNVPPVIVSLDNIREMIYGKYEYHADDEPFIKHLGLRIIRNALEDQRDVVVNDSMWILTRADRHLLINFIRTNEHRVGGIDIVATQLMTPPEICRARRVSNPRTLKAADWHRIIDEMQAQYQPIVNPDDGLNEGFDEVIMIGGN